MKVRVVLSNGVRYVTADFWDGSIGVIPRRMWDTKEAQDLLRYLGSPALCIVDTRDGRRVVEVGDPATVVDSVIFWGTAYIISPRTAPHTLLRYATGAAPDDTESGREWGAISTVASAVGIQL